MKSVFTHRVKGVALIICSKLKVYIKNTVLTEFFRLIGETYKKSIEELNSLALKKSELSAQMSIKFMLIQALRMLFLLPTDKKSLFMAAADILTPEELKCFSQKIK